MMQEKQSMVIVIDEFGGTVGVVTLEDLVEEIFGEIEDEHDNRKLTCKQLKDDEYLFSGRMEIDAINEKFNLALPESDDYATVAGYILHVHQKFPKQKEQITVGKYHFKIIKISATKIELIHLFVAKD